MVYFTLLDLVLVLLVGCAVGILLVMRIVGGTR